MTTPTGSSGSERFIQEGAASYFQATVAVKEFARIVQDECERVVVNRLADLNRATVTEFSSDDLHHWPHRGQLFDPGYPWLCMYFKLEPLGETLVGLYWESKRDGGYQLHGVASFESRDEKIYQKAKQAFDRLPDSRMRSFPNIKGYYDLSVSEPISVEDAPQFTKHVESVLAAFLEEWEKVGGIKILKDGRSKSAR